jgi:hypothetical protein
MREKGRSTERGNASRSQQAVLHRQWRSNLGNRARSQAIGWPEAAIAQGVGKETRSNFIDIQRHENDHVNFLVGALGGSARPKLVALTGWGKDEDLHRSDDAGFDAHVVKAVDIAKLLADVGAARQGLRC